MVAPRRKEVVTMTTTRTATNGKVNAMYVVELLMRLGGLPQAYEEIDARAYRAYEVCQEGGPDGLPAMD